MPRLLGTVLCHPSEDTSRQNYRGPKGRSEFRALKQVPPVTMEVKESTWARYRTRVQLQGGVSHLSQWEPP